MATGTADASLTGRVNDLLTMRSLIHGGGADGDWDAVAIVSDADFSVQELLAVKLVIKCKIHSKKKINNAYF